MSPTLWILAGVGLVSILLLTGCVPFDNHIAPPHTPSDGAVDNVTPPQEPSDVQAPDDGFGNDYGLDDLFGDGEGITPPAVGA